MDAVRQHGWTRFKPVKGQPIKEADMRKVFKLVDLDKDGEISRLVSNLSLKEIFSHLNFPESHSCFCLDENEF